MQVCLVLALWWRRLVPHHQQLQLDWHAATHHLHLPTRWATSLTIAVTTTTSCVATIIATIATVSLDTVSFEPTVLPAIVAVPAAHAIAIPAIASATVLAASVLLQRRATIGTTGVEDSDEPTDVDAE